MFHGYINPHHSVIPSPPGLPGPWPPLASTSRCSPTFTASASLAKDDDNSKSRLAFHRYSWKPMNFMALFHTPNGDPAIRLDY